MAIEKLTEFAKTGQKNTDDLDLETGFIVNRKPARQWFNWLFSTLTTKINEIIDADFMPKSDVVDNLTTNDATKPVSAKQAKLLQDNKLDKTANAVSATKLQTARTIGGVLFDGSVNINLPGVNTPGNQNTTGNAASATKLQTSRQVLFSGAATGSFNFDGSTGTSCTLTLANSGVTAGTYGTTLKIPIITVNAKGLITTVATQDIPSASTSVKGLVQLSNALNSASTVLALTAAQGKKLQDEKLDKSGGTVSSTLTVNGPLRPKQYVDFGYGETLDANRAIVFYSTSTNKKGQIASTTSGAMEFTGATSYSFDKTVSASISGNAASATNCSRSVVAGNGLSGGGELNANRTLTLGTPSTVTASTGNTVSASSHTHSLDVGSLPLLGVGQTWQNVKSNRNINTIYTNSTGRPIIVNITWGYVSGGYNYVNLLVNGISIASGIQSPGDGVSVVIPPGSNYEFSTSGWVITNWMEYR